MAGPEEPTAAAEQDRHAVGSGPASVSVVVPSLGRPGLDRLIGALADQTVPRATFEVVVVLNGPRAEWTPFPVADGLSLRLIHRAEPGRAGAINAAAASSEGELIVLLDDDMEPVPTWLAAHREAHRDPGSGLVLGPVPVAAEDRRRPAGAYVGRRFDRHLAKLIGLAGPVPPADVYTGNASIRRSVFRAIGGFDQRFVEYGNEDREFARRLAEADVPARMAPDAIAIQHYDKEVRALLDDSRAKGRTAAQLVASDDTALSDTPLRRRGSRRRRWVRRLAGPMLALPGAPRAAEVTAAALGFAPAAQDAWIDTLVDAAVWRGAGERGVSNDAARRAGRWSVDAVDAVDAVDDERETILHLVDGATFGGAEQVLVQLVRSLGPAWRNVVIHDRRADRLADRLAGVAGLRTRPFDLASAPRGDVRSVATVLRLIRAIRAESPAIVHVHRPWPRASRGLLLAAGLSGAPVVVTDHLGHRGRAGWRRRVLEAILSRRVRAWIAVSPEVADGLRALGVPSERIHVVRNGVDAPAEASALPPGARRRVAVVAQLRPQKGHETFLRAMTLVPADVSAVLIGDGPERRALERLTDELGLGARVRLAGFVEDVAAELAGVGAVVLPSMFEGFPLAVLEAMAAGRAVVATNVPGTAEIVVDGETGLLAPAGDPTALAAKISEVLDDPDLADRLADAGRARVLAGFRVERVAAEVASIYGSVGGAPRRPRVAAPAGPTERVLDRALRALDPRVLTAAPRPGTIALFGRPGPDVRTAVQLLNEADAAPGDAGQDPESDGARLVVLADPTDGQLAAALRDQAGTGILVLARGARHVAIARATAGAGATVSDVVVPWPIRGRTRAWVPRDAGASVRRFVRDQSAGRGPVRTWAGRVHDLAWTVAARAGSLRAAYVLERRPRPASGADPSLGWGVDDHLARIVLTGGTRSHNRIVVATVRRDDASPVAIALHARRPQSVPGLEREAEMLRALARIEPPLGGVPRLIGVHGRGEALVVKESPVAGVRLSRVLTAPRFEVVAVAIAAAAARLVRPGERLDPDRVADRARPILERFAEFVRAVDPLLVERAREAVAQIGTLPAALEHRDLAPWNLRWREDGRDDRLGILDWESAVVEGLPGLDLEYGLAHLAFDLQDARGTDRQALVLRAMQDPATAVGSAVAAARSAYGRATGVEQPDLARLGVLAWLLHASSEFDRLAGDAGGRASAPAILGARFLRFVRIRLDEL